MDKRYIVVEGPIGVGKTSLVQMLGEVFASRVILEKAAENPFLPKFYTNPAGFAFQTQMFFLLSRYQQQRELAQQELFSQSVICDYLFAKDRIFASVNLDGDELALYQQIYSLLDQRIPKPDLVIYLQSPPEVLQQRIRMRGRSFEREISREYIEAVNEGYNRFFFNYSETPLLIINTAEVDFVRRPEDFQDLVREIRRMKKGVQFYVPLGSA
ncbi:MAG: deoxynucleoside kinase [bacterium]|nr:deoxynucleoside kinase [bacterium]MDT8395364.1 deoxynucleoside kinase [bacterium]